MKKTFLTLVILASLTTVVSCSRGTNSNSGSNSTEHSDIEPERRLEVGKERLLQINNKEKDIEEKGLIKFDQDLTSGGTSIEYKINYKGKTIADRLEAYVDLEEYVNLLETLLSDYPADQYYISGRDELKVKLSLAKKAIQDLKHSNKLSN